MKFLKEDGTIEIGEPLTDAQANEMERVEELLHTVICNRSNHYDWQGVPLCKKLAIKVASGVPLIEALDEHVNPKIEPAPEPAPVPEPAAVAVIQDDDIPL